MKIIFNDIVEFDANQIWEKFQNGEFFISVSADIDSDYDFNTKINTFNENIPNGIVEKITIYNDNKLMNELNQHYQVEGFTKSYNVGPNEKTNLLIEIRKRPDLDKIAELEQEEE